MQLTRAERLALDYCRRFNGEEFRLEYARLQDVARLNPEDAGYAMDSLRRLGLIELHTVMEPRPRRHYCRVITRNPGITLNYSIRVEPADKGFAVRGAVSIPSSKAPIVDAAKALKAAGASDHDVIVANGSVVSISPTMIGAVLNYAPSAKRRDIESKRFTFMPNNFA